MATVNGRKRTRETKVIKGYTLIVILKKKTRANTISETARSFLGGMSAKTTWSEPRSRSGCSAISTFRFRAQAQVAHFTLSIMVPGLIKRNFCIIMTQFLYWRGALTFRDGPGKDTLAPRSNSMGFASSGTLSCITGLFL